MRLFILVIFSCLCAIQSAHGGDVAVLSSPEFRHPPTIARVRAIVQEVRTEFHISDEALPNMIVVFVSRSEADVQRLPKAHTVSDRFTRDGAVLYQVWIIDDPSEAAVVDAIVYIAEHEAGSRRSSADLANITHRICTRLRSVVNAIDLRQNR